MAEARQKSDIAKTMDALGAAARGAGAAIGRAPSAARNGALRAAAVSLRSRSEAILAANGIDLDSARTRELPAALLDRLALDAGRVEAMARGLEDIAGLPDPLGRVIAEWQRPNGLCIQRVSVPLGVIGIIYESRPNVTADAAGLCIKSGNAVILRGGSESFHSNIEIYESVREGLLTAGLDGNAVQIVPTTDRDAVGYLLSSMQAWLDVVVPRGGRSLVRRVQEEARVPVIGHLDGICHVYVHRAAAKQMAIDVVVNAKMRRPGICGAAETVLVDRDAAPDLLPAMVDALIEAGCEVRGDATVRAANDAVVAATAADWGSEYLDAIVSIAVVDGLDAAVAHIARYGSGHTESIVTADAEAAERFLDRVDSAIVLHNASTQFADGGEFGMGAEIGIATGRVHARGPVGAEQLTSYKYIVRGSGQTRP